MLRAALAVLLVSGLFFPPCPALATTMVSHRAASATVGLNPTHGFVGGSLASDSDMHQLDETALQMQGPENSSGNVWLYSDATSEVIEALGSVVMPAGSVAILSVNSSGTILDPDSTYRVVTDEEMETVGSFAFGGQATSPNAILRLELQNGLLQIPAGSRQ